MSLVSNVITSTIGQEKFEKLSGFHFRTFLDPKHRLVRIDAGVTNPILFSSKGLKVKKCWSFVDVIGYIDA